jgi:hypothetical protein
MRINFTVSFRRVAAVRTSLVAPLIEPPGRAPRIARLLALAHKLDAMVHSGEISDYAQLARLGRISPTRLTQIMILLHLAPAIQEYILFLSAADARFVTELGLRKIAREPHWDRQRELFEQFLQNGLACVRKRSDQCRDAATAAKGRPTK